MGVRKSIYNFLIKRGFKLRKQSVQVVGSRNYLIINDSLRTDDYDDAWTLAIARRSHVIFDIGSNMGQAALLMMYSDNIQNIFLVDPNPEALSIAAENFIFNNLSHLAHFIPSFVSDKADETIEFYTVGAGAAGSMYSKHAKTAATNKSHLNVPTTTIDKLCEFYKVYPDFIKIDVEGAELMVLKGAVKTVEKQRPKILVEMHSNPDLPMTENATMLLDWCTKNGYTPWYMKNATVIENIETVSKRGRFHAFLLPAGVDYPSYLRTLGQGASIQEAING